MSNKHRKKIIIFGLLTIILVLSVFFCNKENISFSNLLNKYNYETVEELDSIKIELVGLNSKNDEKVYYEIPYNQVANAKATVGDYDVTEEIIDDSINVAKIWNVSSRNKDKIPESIKLQLKKSGEVIEEWTVSEENNWETDISSLMDVTLADPTGDYTLEESAVNEGELDSFVGDFQIVIDEETQEMNLAAFNTYVTYIDVEFTKVWNDNNNAAGKRPNSVTFNIKNGNTEELIETITLNDTNNWTTSLYLPECDETTGEEIEYVLEEVEASKFYVPTITSEWLDRAEQVNSSEEENSEPEMPQVGSEPYLNYTITNTFSVPDTKVEVPVEKVWEDNDNYAGKRPDSVNIQLLQNGEVYKTQTITSDMNWKYTFTDLPEYDENADKYTYTIKETTTPEFYTSSVEGYKITNTFYVPDDKISIPVKKIWIDNDNAASKRPSTIEIQLLNENEVIESTHLTSLTDWEFTFENLPKYDSLANEIKYTIDEKETPQFYKKTISGYEISNTFYVPEDTISINVNKVWDDNNNKAQKRPSSVTLQIKDSTGIVKEQTITESNNWQFTFTNLPKYDEQANEIEYFVDEKETTEFYVKTIVDNTITNKFVVPEDIISIPVTKIWNDENNKNNTRPSSIIVQLKDEQDNIISEGIMSESTNWTYEFKVAKYNDLGNEITYTIDEKDVAEGYTKIITNYNIENKIKLLKIDTKVSCKGGVITGAEEVTYGSSSTPNNIVITPNEGFLIDYVKVNGKKITIDQYEELVLNNFEQMKEDATIDVCFIQTGTLGETGTAETSPEENPETADLKIISIIISSIMVIITLILSRKKLKSLQ